MCVLETGDNGLQLGKHFFRITFRAREIVGEVYLVFLKPPQAMNGELGAVLVNLNQALDLDEVVTVKRIHHLFDVVPHLGFDLARSIGQVKREIRITGFLLPDFF